jgi:hypothetical protein
MNHITVKISPSGHRGTTARPAISTTTSRRYEFLQFSQSLHAFPRRATSFTFAVLGLPIYASTVPLCTGALAVLVAQGTPSFSKASVSWTFPANCGVTTVLKAHIRGIVSERFCPTRRTTRLRFGRIWTRHESGIKNTSDWEKTLSCAVSKRRSRNNRALEGRGVQKAGLAYREGV